MKLFVVVATNVDEQDRDYAAAVFAKDHVGAMADFRGGSPSWGDIPDEFYDTEFEASVHEFDGYQVFGPYEDFEPN